MRMTRQETGWRAGAKRKANRVKCLNGQRQVNLAWSSIKHLRDGISVCPVNLWVVRDEWRNAPARLP